ncbi:hypothetical protein U1Q18_009373 [Sarracenia purpurea var. burkii]
MASRLQKRMTLHKKLHALRILTNSKSVKKSCIIMDAFIHIYKLKLKLEALRRQHCYLINHIQVLEVEKVGEEFEVRVTCQRGQDVLASILRAFEEMGLTVVQARVSCNFFLSIEAIVEAQDQGVDVRDIKEAVHKAIGKQYGLGTQNKCIDIFK